MAKITKLTNVEDGKIKAPMSPMMASQSIAEILNMGIRAIYRINFDSEQVWNKWDPKPSITGNDHLIVVMRAGKTFGAAAFVDEGVGCVPVGLMFDTDQECEFTAVYRKQKFIAVPTDEEITTLVREALNAEIELAK